MVTFGFRSSRVHHQAALHVYNDVPVALSSYSCRCCSTFSTTIKCTKPKLQPAAQVAWHSARFAPVVSRYRSPCLPMIGVVTVRCVDRHWSDRSIPLFRAKHLACGVVSSYSTSQSNTDRERRKIETEPTIPLVAAMVVSVRRLRRVGNIGVGLGLLHHCSRHRIWR